MKRRIRDLAIQRIYRIIYVALMTARYDLELAEKQAMIVKHISMKYRIRLPYEIRQLFCKRCKRFIVPGINSIVRTDSNPKSVRIKCLKCNHVYRKVIK